MIPTLEHVACIDDDEDILHIVTLALKDIGQLTVTAISSAQRSFDQLIRKAPDLILLDVMMPGMDGPTFLGELKQRPTMAHIPVVFMTARIQAADLLYYQTLGAAGVVPKPFDPLLLSNELQAIWKKWHTAAVPMLQVVDHPIA